MKIVIYTQRVEQVESYHEVRDCADQNIPRFIEACGYLALPICNVNSNIPELVELLKPKGIVLTGGNSLVKYGGTAPERDLTDRQLIELALEKGIPLYGFCRGMQSILDYFGVYLQTVKEHVAVAHRISGDIEDRIVNSYHREAAVEVLPPLKAESRSVDGVVESVIHENGFIYGTMWHPEREQPFKQRDIVMLQKLFS